MSQVHVNEYTKVKVIRRTWKGVWSYKVNNKNEIKLKDKRLHKLSVSKFSPIMNICYLKRLFLIEYLKAKSLYCLYSVSAALVPNTPIYTMNTT